MGWAIGLALPATGHRGMSSSPNFGYNRARVLSPHDGYAGGVDVVTLVGKNAIRINQKYL